MNISTLKVNGRIKNNLNYGDQTAIFKSVNCLQRYANK